MIERDWTKLKDGEHYDKCDACDYIRKSCPEFCKDCISKYFFPAEDAKVISKKENI